MKKDRGQILAGETRRVIVVLAVDVVRCGYPTKAGTTYQGREV